MRELKAAAAPAQQSRSRTARRRAPPADMDSRTLILLALYAASATPVPNAPKPPTPLEQTIKSRRDAFSTYAHQFTQDYEPFAYAAIPLHSPMPVIAILADKPLVPTNPKTYGQHAYASSIKHTSYVRPEYLQNVKPDLQNYEYNPTKYTQYAKLLEEYPKKPQVDLTQLPPLDYNHYVAEYVKNYAPIDFGTSSTDYIKPHSSMDAPTILYARPSENGGYTYHRRPQKNRRVKRPRKEKPLIIRVHKHRVIRDRKSGY